MHSLHKRLFTLLACAVFLLTPSVLLAIEVGAPAPGFSLKSIEEKQVSLADYKGHVVILKLATTWCPTCKQLSGEIDKISEFLKEQEVVVLEVFVQDSPEMVERYLKGKSSPMIFHALLDDGQAYEAYSVYLIPRLVVIDPAGLVTYDSAGQSVSADDLKRLVEKAKTEQAG